MENKYKWNNFEHTSFDGLIEKNGEILPCTFCEDEDDPLIKEVWEKRDELQIEEYEYPGTLEDKKTRYSYELEKRYKECSKNSLVYYYDSCFSLKFINIIKYAIDGCEDNIKIYDYFNEECILNKEQLNELYILMCKAEIQLYNDYNADMKIIKNVENDEDFLKLTFCDSYYNNYIISIRE